MRGHGVVVAAAYEQHGFRAFLKKPYTIGNLRQTLHSLLA